MIEDANGELVEIVRVVKQNEHTDIVLATDGLLHVIKVSREKKPVKRKMNLPQSKPSLQQSNGIIRVFNQHGELDGDYPSIKRVMKEYGVSLRSVQRWLESGKPVGKGKLKGYRFFRILGE